MYNKFMDVDEILENYTNELKPEINLNKLNLGDHQSKLPSLKHKWAGRYINHKRRLIKLKCKKKDLRKELTAKYIFLFTFQTKRNILHTKVFCFSNLQIGRLKPRVF